MDVSAAENPSTGDSVLIRAEGLWFEDFGLIIQAERTLFRVSRDFLAVRSPVFQDMLSLPTPQSSDMMDGCPFVCLPDTAQDITYFLKALIYSEFFEPFPARVTFPVISSVLRMSHKYEVDALRKRALIHLSSCHPTQLADWEDLPNTSSWLPDTTSHYLEIILLAHQVSALWILPVAFYRACESAKIEDTIAGVPGCSLNTADVVACVTGLRYLETTGASQLLSFLCALTIEGCKSPVDCTELRVKNRFEAEN
ncbi:hypothetical protein B0H13DRAFT_1723032 [Mycena leptocephala]|nr:hypothetical protein B0H13DRAFT_1723032 [Mycena leptocephala]